MKKYFATNVLQYSNDFRFAHFFASPLLNSSSLEREIQAVDSGIKEKLHVHAYYTIVIMPAQPAYMYIHACIIQYNVTTLHYMHFSIKLLFFPFFKEFQTSIQSDTPRIQQLFCSLAVSGHPLACFPWGTVRLYIIHMYILFILINFSFHRK